jgi:antitoxin YefM
MKTMTYSESRANYAEITRAGQEPVVIVPLSDYESLKEAVYLFTTGAEKIA